MRALHFKCLERFLFIKQAIAAFGKVTYYP